MMTSAGGLRTGQHGLIERSDMQLVVLVGLLCQRDWLRLRPSGYIVGLGIKSTAAFEP